MKLTNRIKKFHELFFIFKLRLVLCQWVIIRSVFGADKISVYKLDIQNIKKCFLDYWTGSLPEITKQLNTSKWEKSKYCQAHCKLLVASNTTVLFKSLATRSVRQHRKGFKLFIFTSLAPPLQLWWEFFGRVFL